ncbi:hypothetical protein [Sphingomonas sp. HMP6]|uniref:hypothetical protein n=1 Tax=Sphingomonas sp. HMP6 TaxID=1517551 RepID=UPI001596A71E|nr:hypothetical protein [Sphingomonas sp. HMP6]BCA59523.1 hypothetical protein HMP06_2292 [Sphingomonas sp. HMP6]
MNIDRLIAGLSTRTKSERATMRATAESWIESGTPDQQDAGRRFTVALDALEATEVATQSTRVNGMSLTDRVVAAFRANRMTPTDEKVIRVLLDNPGTTSAGLSTAMGWKAQAWHLHFGTMCFDRATYLWAGPVPAKGSKAFMSGVLADLETPGNRFTMKPEAVAGFAALGIRQRAGSDA